VQLYCINSEKAISFVPDFLKNGHIIFFKRIRMGLKIWRRVLGISTAQTATPDDISGIGE
jgi:hypothetical protein